MDPRLVSSAIERARATDEAAMLDECRIRRPGSGAGAVDPNTGVLTPAAGTIVYEGQCRLGSIGESVDVQSSDQSAAGPLRFELKIPVGSGEVRNGDTVELLDVNDPESVVDGLLERTWRVGADPSGQWRVRRRLLVEEVVRGG